MSSITTVFDYMKQTPLSIAIAVLYVMFFWRLADHVTQASILVKRERKARDAEYRSKNKQVAFNFGTSNDTDEPEQLEESSKTLKAKVEAAEFQKHAMLIGSGVLGICVSANLGNQSVQTGLGWGSVMCILAAITIQWHNYKDTQKLCICGGGLAALVAFAVTMLPEHPRGRSVTEAM